MPKQNQEGLRLEKVVIKNFKNIESFSFDFNGGSYILIGGNAAGKSAVIQAIQSPINSSYTPVSPLKTGEEHGEVKVSFGGTLNGERVEYNTEVYFNAATGKGRLIVKNANGEVIKSQANTMKALLKSISLDPLEFARATAATQVAMLKEITGLDFTELDLKKGKIKDDKAIVNASLKAKLNDLETHGMSEEDMRKYSKPVEVAPINEELNSIGKKITDWNDLNNRVIKHQETIEGLDNAISIKERDIISAKEKIEELQLLIEVKKAGIEDDKRQKAEAEKKLTAGREWQKKNPTPPTSHEILLRLEEANEHNKKYDKVQELIAKHNAVEKDKAEIEKLNSLSKDIDKEKKELLSKANIPVEGLTFDSDGVYINGIPFNSKDLNTAQQIEYGVKIAMALNPDLRLIIIQDGSLLDNNTTAEVFKACTEKGYQLLIERVRPEGGDTELIFMEEKLK